MRPETAEPDRPINTGVAGDLGQVREVAAGDVRATESASNRGVPHGGILFCLRGAFVTLRFSPGSGTWRFLAQ
jgi:hypothetical protein